MMSTDILFDVLSCDPTDHRRHPLPGASGVKLATEASHEVTRQASEGRIVTGDSKTILIRKQQRISTWNVNGLLQAGKLSIVEKEMENHNLSILGICETHMRNNGHFKTSTGNTVYFSGNENSSRNGVAIVLPPYLNQYVLGYHPISDRILTLKLNTKPFITNVIQIYAPTAQAKYEDIDDFYHSLDATLGSIPNREITFIPGDWNAKVGETTADGHIRRTVGNFGLGKRNDRGERFLEFCVEKDLTILNTCFQHHARRLYTWKSPGDRFRNQINYILINSRWRSTVSNVKTYPGADCGSDHVLLVANFRLRLKAQKRKMQFIDPDKQDSFRNALEKQLLGTTPPASESAEGLWQRLKSSIASAVSETVPKQAKQKRSMWISNDTWELIERRRTCTGSDKIENYNALSKDIKQRCRRDKNIFIENIYKGIESHSLKLQSSDLFKKVRLLSKKYKAKTWVIGDEDGDSITDLQLITERWRRYCESLYKNPTNDTTCGPDFVWADIVQEPSILHSEIKATLKKLKDNKAPGHDNITAETLKHSATQGIDVLHKICNHIWQNGEWPDDWRSSIILPHKKALHKKGSTKDCNNYRTLALISHASKILLHIINSRIRHFLDWQIPQEQAGFVKGRGTREQILNIRQLIERCHEFDTPIILCFVDYSKAFDCVGWNCLWRVLQELGVPMHLKAFLQSLYYGSQGTVRVDYTMSNRFNFRRGVRQGCILSPILFNIYGEYIMRKTLENWDGGITIGGVKVTNLRYADDTTLLATTEAEMTELLNRMEHIGLEMGLALNRSKTKIMVVDRTKKLELSGTLNLELVDNFIYLGSNINNTGSSELEVRRRIGMAKGAMTQLGKIWKDHNITQKTKTKLVLTLVFSIFIYGAETWTLKAADRKRVDAFEMWCWRRMLRIPWTAKRSNQSILDQLQIKTRLSTLCLRRALEYFGHIARKTPDSLERLFVTGKHRGKETRGRSPTGWFDQIAPH
uniref:Endonuclease-reverse transcriptase n=1 Tax=Bombyx mori TaxID=7091 RepID=D7F168_BOMMO|nr:endonuclease-reverse transcriptase [Bombyx mori]